ncbi:L-threonylcarbamoyladenylate synthase [Leptolyngbya sp. FACHB-261]|uniref:L-threonylcarbamoyladenylate synthase n=1 Tax=Leptolyngbya sp. FACHB-261 TaxID=2692806 RepID=UPI001687D759|nr:L-threonylcarbamoyladenylate synthase [Leptolyngbya sp. FACHB-261]MBD2102864.1 threonylcarbamoyl-AMP synthase [Leptolyngbya sp. FACHB-261]
MAITYPIHPETPQLAMLGKITAALRDGAVMLYPTDTVYAIGCDLNSKKGVTRVRQIKQLSNDKPLTFLCPSLSDIANYAVVSDPAYRLMRHLVPGPFTFLLPATKLVPKLVMNPKRRTVGIRVPAHPIARALLTTLGNPLISTSAHLPEEVDVPDQSVERALLFDELSNQVDLIVNDGRDLPNQVSTILDLTDDEPQVLRQGLGWDKVAHLIG